MEEILKELMSTKCVSMHNNQFRCYGKKCDGQCALFQKTLNEIQTKNCEWLETHTYNINDSGICLDFSEFKEAKESILNL